MRGAKLAVLAAAAAAPLALAVAGVLCTAPPADGATLYGVHQDLTQDGHKWRRHRAIARADRVLHAQVSRSSFLWHQIERRRGIRSWRRTDAVVRELEAAGIEPLFTVFGSPSWANGIAEGTPGHSSYVPTKPAAFRRWVKRYAAFMRVAARRYRGRVRKWEIGNEQNEHFVWKPEPNVDQYARWYTAVRDAVLREDPRAQVALGGLAGIAAGGDIPGITFLRLLNARGVYPDYVALHPYPSGDHAPAVHLRWQDNFDDIGLVRDYLNAIGRPVPIWVTEWGWPSSTLGAETQARYVATSLGMIEAQYRFVTVATYFVDYDRPEYSQGLFDANLQPKPAAWRFGAFAARHAPRLSVVRAGIHRRRLVVRARYWNCGGCRARLHLRTRSRRRSQRMRRRGSSFIGRSAPLRPGRVYFAVSLTGWAGSVVARTPRRSVRLRR